MKTRFKTKDKIFRGEKNIGDDGRLAIIKET